MCEWTLILLLHVVVFVVSVVCTGSIRVNPIGRGWGRYHDDGNPGRQEIRKGSEWNSVCANADMLMSTIL